MGILESVTKDKSDLFWSKVSAGDKSACWPWLGYQNKHGYGQYKLARKARWAHRVAYALHHNTEPDGLVIRHSCDNPSCCNPHHMLTGSLADNVADRVARQRSAFGTKNCNAKLTEDAVRKIRKDSRPVQVIADEYGVHYSNISRVRRNESWTHVE